MPRQEPTQLFRRAFDRPEGLLAGSFVGLILIGGLLLSFPFARTGTALHPADALFTATSAVCVTGLVVLDTGTDFTPAGQMIILGLIQLGGLGIMTFAALIVQVAGSRKLSFRSQAALQDLFYQRQAAARFRRNLKWIVLLSLGLEAAGAGLLFGQLPDEMGRGEAARTAVFHAVSAFCNAGFSTFSDSLAGQADRLGFMATLCGLIILGGLGYVVLFELIGRAGQRLRGRPTPIVWSLHTRVVLRTSALLILAGVVVFSLFGLGSAEPQWASRMGHALFQSITARTAGFNTVDIAAAPLTPLLWLIFLMFVGGSPGSCAGGIKTTSLAIWLARLKARLAHRQDVTLAGRRIPSELVRRAALLIGVSALYNLVGILVLATTEAGQADAGLKEIVFEQVSAFATVGLTTGLTPTLTLAGKIWITLTMLVGRLGPLTVALIMVDHRRALVRLPEEQLMIG